MECQILKKTGKKELRGVYIVKNYTTFAPKKGGALVSGSLYHTFWQALIPFGISSHFQ